MYQYQEDTDNEYVVHQIRNLIYQQCTIEISTLLAYTQIKIVFHSCNTPFQYGMCQRRHGNVLKYRYNILYIAKKLIGTFPNLISTFLV